MKTPDIRGKIGLGLLLSVLMAGALGFANVRVLGQSSVVNRSVTVQADPTPDVSTVTLNSGDFITLTANATTVVRVNFTVTDGTGCGHIFFSGNVTTTVFRSGVATSSCAANTLNCYVVSTTTHSCPSATSSQQSANATATVEIYYFAQATDASSSFPSENWVASVIARDGSSTIDTATSTGVELISMLALELTTSTLSYLVLPGSNTGANNTTMPIKNAGNTSSSLRISGTALASGSNIIATSSQHYATSTFTFGGLEQVLNSIAQGVSGFLIPRPVFSRWVNTTNLPSAIANHSTVAINNYIYRIGGSTTSSVLFAPINATGSIGAWSATTPLPTSTDEHSSVSNTDYLYMLGGSLQGAISTSSVLFAPINATGSIGAWTNTTPLSGSRWSHSSVVRNGYIYVLGGTSGGAQTSSVLFAPINATGSVGTWINTTPLTAAKIGFEAVVSGDYIYAIGGSNISDGETSTVLFAPINATGSIGQWSATTPLPTGTASHAAVSDGSTLYIFGGSTVGNVITSTSYFAPITSNGSIGGWSQMPSLPDGIRSSGGNLAATHNGSVYFVGGNIFGQSTSGVRFAPLASRNTYWGAEVPAGTATGTYTGTVSFVGVFEP